MASLIVYIVSDSVGETGELVARAAASQFDAGKTLWKRFTHVTDVNSLREIAMAAASDHGLIVFTLASSTLRTAMMKLASAYDVSVVDVLGPPIRTIASSLGMASNEEVGGLRKLDERYFRRVEAMEFAVQYDDGKDPQGFKEADVVILGVSRTSKTPVCMYLAHKNIKAANYPVVPETPIPDVIFEIPPKKIFGLTINPQNLNEIRTQRSHYHGRCWCRHQLCRPPTVYWKNWILPKGYTAVSVAACWTLQIRPSKKRLGIY